MANKKISELIDAEELTGAEFVPVNQSGITKKVAMSDIRSVGGKELEYAERLTNDASSDTVNYKDIAGLAITLTGDGVTPIMLEVWIFAGQHSAASSSVTIVLQEGTTLLAFSSAQVAGAGGFSSPACIRRRIIPTVGSHTYKVSFRPVGAGTATIWCDPTAPAFIRATN